MHELAVCQGLLGQIADIAEREQAEQVDVIHLRIGPLAGVEAELLQQAFSIARAGTLAANAKLVIDAQPIRVRCSQCGADSEASANRLLCAHCGDFRTRLISGDELLLASVELTRADPRPT